MISALLLQFWTILQHYGLGTQNMILTILLRYENAWLRLEFYIDPPPNIMLPL
jgi:hypothetical protein